MPGFRGLSSVYRKVTKGAEVTRRDVPTGSLEQDPGVLVPRFFSFGVKSFFIVVTEPA